MTRCPNCNTVLNADNEVYVINGELVACDMCCRTTYADEFFDEDEFDLEEMLDQVMWEQAKERRIERMFDL